MGKGKKSYKQEKSLGKYKRTKAKHTNMEKSENQVCIIIMGSTHLEK